MKKLLALILAGAMLVSFAACGGNESNEEETTTNASQEVQGDVADETTAPEETQAEEATDAEEDATKAPAASNADVADAADLLSKVWATYAEEEKFFAMGGDMENIVDGAPGKFDVSKVEDLDGTLGLPQASAAQIDDAASILHAMNANTFTGAAYHLTAGTDAAAFVDALKANIQARHWMCGIPEKLLIVTVGDYVVAAFGAGDIIENFKTKLAAQFDAAEVVVEEPIV